MVRKSNRAVARRILLPTLGTALIVAGAACGVSQPGSEGASDNVIVIADGGGGYHESLLKSTYEPCEEKLGIEVQSTSYDYSLGTIRAHEEGAKEWDIVGVGRPAPEDVQAELFEPIDYSVVDNPGMRDENRHKYMVVYSYFGNVLAHNTDALSTAPKEWRDMWDYDRFPGSRAMSSTPMANLEVALMADGVAPGDLYPLDVDRAFESLTKLRDSGEIVWYESGAEQVQFLSSGVASMGIGWNGRMNDAMAESAPVDYTLRNSVLSGFAWAVLSTAPHKDAAMEFLKCATSAEVSANDTIDYPGQVPANDDAFEHLPSDVSEQLPNSPENKGANALVLDWEWWSKNYGPVDARYQEWLTE